jgi:hypothetical protein
MQSNQEPISFDAEKLPIMLKFNYAINEYTFSR